MNVLVIFDSNNQDTSLGGVLEGVMKQNGWQVFIGFTFAFQKSFDDAVSDIEIKRDVDSATFEAEWEDVNYLYVIGSNAPKFAISPGDK